MKKAMNKALLAAAVAGTLSIISTGAVAALFNPFGVTESSVPGAMANPTLAAPNAAGKIIGNYIENVTFSGGTSGTFATSIKFSASDFVAPDGSTSVTNQLGSSALNANQYYLYALLNGTGTYAPGAKAGTTVFTFNPGGSLSAFIDPSSDTTFTGVTPTGGTAEDYMIATGAVINGSGTLDPSLSTCSAGGGQGINCGSFGSTTSFLLTAAGSKYFTSPTPFYNLSFQSGQFDYLVPTAGGTQTTSGSLDVAFGNAPVTVPEPASLALMGIGLMGLGLSARRRKNKQA